MARKIDWDEVDYVETKCVWDAEAGEYRVVEEVFHPAKNRPADGEASVQGVRPGETA